MTTPPPQDFPLLRLDALADAPSTVLGFSMFNTSHPFYLEFVRSLNMSWRENCELSPYPGPAVRGGPNPGETLEPMEGPQKPHKCLQNPLGGPQNPIRVFKTSVEHQKPGGNAEPWWEHNTLGRTQNLGRTWG